jgi:hypothetical protein
LHVYSDDKITKFRASSKSYDPLEADSAEELVNLIVNHYPGKFIKFKNGVYFFCGQKYMIDYRDKHSKYFSKEEMIYFHSKRRETLEV